MHGREDWGIKFAISVTVFGTVALGVFPQMFYDGAKASVRQLREEAPMVVSAPDKPLAVIEK